MNQNYCVIDYFDADIQPSSAHYFLAEPQRKPSYDDLLNGLLATQQDQTPAQATQQSPKLKGRKTKQKTSSQNKIRRQVNTNKTVAEGMQRGHWGQQENKRYHWFLELHCQHFLNKHLRRMDKIFKTMEKFVKSRQAEQCRSHHQKMQKKYGNFINILKHLRLQLNQAGDAQFVATEMKNNGVQLNTQLLSWQMLQRGITHCQQKQDMGCTSVEVSPCSQRFTDPLAQLECECILQLLIL